MKKQRGKILCFACLSLLMTLVMLSIASGKTDAYGLQEETLVATVFETGVHSRDFEEVRYVIL